MPASKTVTPVRRGEATDAWILRRGTDGAPRQRGELERTTVELPPLPDDRVLVETLYGSWEGNMTHALNRDPIDVCRRFGQDMIVLGNSGVVRVLSVGKGVDGVKEGTVCIFQPIGKEDEWGYVLTVTAFDEPHTMGCLAARFHVRPSQLVPVPDGTDIAPSQWASFPVRYATAWSNWRVADGAWRLQMPDLPPDRVHVWAWGGGVAFGELILARQKGYRTAMLYTGAEREQMIREAGITPVDRSQFPELTVDPPDTNRKALVQYLKSERTFLRIVDELTNGDRVSIFIDNIGGPLMAPTLRALGRQGVVATSGWKQGLDVRFNRALACISRHMFIHTHACPLHEGLDAFDHAIRTGWVPLRQNYIYGWDEIPRLADDHAAGRIASYFPTFAAPAADA